MKRNHSFIGLTMITIVAAGLLALNPSGRNAVQKNNNCTCCKQNIKGCAAKNDTNIPDETVMESFSRQFLSLTSSPY